MEQLINITDAVFLGHVGEVELGASAIAGIYYLAIYMLGFGFSIGLQVMIARGMENVIMVRLGRYSFKVSSFLSGLAILLCLLMQASSSFILGKVDFLTGDLSGCNSVSGLAQFRFAVFVSVFGYPFFSCGNNMHSGIIVGCSRCSSD